MLDEVLWWGDWGGGEAKVGWWGGCSEGWLGGKLIVEGSNLAAHRGFKRWLFREQKLMVCGCSIIFSYVSSMLDCRVILCSVGLCG